MDVQQLEKLNELREKGILTEQEFAEQKQKILVQSSTSLQQFFLQTHNYTMLMHLAQLCVFILPVLGWVVPLVMWLSRNEDSTIDRHGKVIFNWILSFVLYAFASLLLTVIIIGFPMLLALMICSIAFTVLGAIKAKDGVIENYPLAIRFFRIDAPETA
ncbi:DUF4870 domain-containing protein [Alkalimonas sp. MEB108]|uniref:DUF4870 domain-containing protein n=1 Tax=Alkalimonas cellulosilytica TaxID=3058395 RepID=A0ABU7J3H1_9GAMM|nr:DUF4870 domain-containing protein [Alkalimonas sp. MEB108]MEE2001045.1 DUF4870 domain-containing protein [Alkalimonas sp. MEB108]